MAVHVGFVVVAVAVPLLFLLHHTAVSIVDTIGAQRSAQDWPHATCTVTSLGVGENCQETMCVFRSEVGVTFKPQTGAITTTTAHRHLSGLFVERLDEAERFLKQFSRGKNYPCWYDPSEPSTVLMERENPGANTETNSLIATTYFLALGLLALVACLTASTDEAVATNAEELHEL